MTSAVIENGDYLGFLDQPTNKATKVELPIEPNSTKISRVRRATFSEILVHACPTSEKIVEFTKLIEQIRMIQQINSLSERDDSQAAEAIFLLSDVLNIHWHEFTWESKVLLLDKLQVFNQNEWQFIVSNFTSTFETIKSRINLYKSYYLELISSNEFARKNIYKKTAINLKLFQKAWFSLQKTTLQLFEEDGYLLERNRESISELTHKLRGSFDQTSNFTAPQALDFSKMTLQERTAIIEKHQQHRQKIIDSLTPEELAISNQQFEHMFRQLKESRN